MDTWHTLPAHVRAWIIATVEQREDIERAQARLDSTPEGAPLG